MLINAFTIWSDKTHLIKITENLLFEKHRNAFLWPNKLSKHKKWVETKTCGSSGKLSYIPVATQDKLSSLMCLGITSIYIDTRCGSIDSSFDHDIIVTGVNSIHACRRAVDFVAGQLTNKNRFLRGTLVILPDPPP
jgi:hypothetical protein